ncbi:MAG TPA: hypothetical protein DDZ88_28445 [Verrucomicrobiales bacterium]|nr:hypothetical protein [Verrucomicrobiales bacterium]
MINPGITASLICPACGQAFLTMQQSMAGVTQCPHCAHSGPRANFGTQSQVAGVAQVRRRVAQAQPPPDAAPPVFQPPSLFAAPGQPPAAWPASPPAPVPRHAPFVTRNALQHSEALMPVGEPPEPMDFDMPPQARGSPWKGAFILLVLAIVLGAAGWLWCDQSHPPASAPMAADTASLPSSATPEVRRAQTPTQAETSAAKIDLPDTAAYATDAKALVHELLAADTPERRAACVHEAEKHTAEIEALFGSSVAERIDLRLLARIPGLPLTLPGGQPLPIFKLATSKCAAGAIIRLTTGTDGKRRIHWPTFYETHEGRLEAFLKQPGAESAWFHVGLRPSHGLDIPAELRPKYLTFDVQTTATSETRFVACVERDTRLGRFLDRETDWGRAYLSRLLVRRLDIEADAPCMIIVDCEGAAER